MNSDDPTGQRAAYSRWLELPEADRRKMQQRVGMALFGATAGCCEVCDLLVRVREGVGAAPTWSAAPAPLPPSASNGAGAEDELIEIEVNVDGQPQIASVSRREFEERLRLNA